MLDRLRYHLRAVFRRAAVEREMREEMQQHLDRRVESLVAAGMSLGDARLAARREFGTPIGLFAAHFLPALEARGGISEPRAPSMLLVGSLVAGVVLVVTTIATLIPASRAATVDPVAALRVE